MVTNQQITIRKGKPYDVSNLCRLLEQTIPDGDGYYPEPDQNMAIQWVTSILNEGYVLVAEKSGRLIGTVAVTDFCFPWSPKRYLYVDWMYVSKSFRDGGVFAGLMQALHAFADEREAPIYGGISSGRDARLKDRLMTMNGYHYLGGQFIRDLSLQEIEDGQREEDDQDDAELHAAELDQ